MYSDMSTWIIASSSPNRNSASVRASSVLPTPDGPRKMNEPVGRFGSLMPARAADLVRHGGDRLFLADHALVQLVLHVHELLRLGLGELEHRDARPHRDDVGDLLLADFRLLRVGLVLAPVLLELALLLRELALLVPERRRLLELLVLDRVFLVLADLLDLLLQLAVARRRAHRANAHARPGLVDQVDRLVGQVPILDVAVGERGGRMQGL